MKLFEIVNRKTELGAEYGKIHEEYINATNKIKSEVKSLEELESIAMNGINIDYVQLAESVMYVNGNPYGATDEVKRSGYATIASNAICDIASGCKHLKKQFYGNKEYSGYYQRTDCEYGMGPRHGSIVDEIGLKGQSTQRDLTDDEKDACIYYLKNYAKIKEAKKAIATA